MKEYKTTVGCQETDIEDADDPRPPEDDGNGEWTLACASADHGRIYWFWERDASTPPVRRAKYLVIVARPRYQEDAWINGVREPSRPSKPAMPGLVNGLLELWIDLDLCRVAFWPDGTTAAIHYKVGEEGVYHLVSEAGVCIESSCGFVPKTISPDGLSDYLKLYIGVNGTVHDYADDFIHGSPWQPGRFSGGFQ